MLEKKKRSLKKKRKKISAFFSFFWTSRKGKRWFAPGGAHAERDRAGQCPKHPRGTSQNIPRRRGMLPPAWLQAFELQRLKRLTARPKEGKYTIHKAGFSRQDGSCATQPHLPGLALRFAPGRKFPIIGKLCFLK